MLNTEKLKTEFLMSESELYDFLQISKDSLKVDLKNFEGALSNHNENLIKKTAHKLKSGFNYLNLPEVATVFDDIYKIENLLPQIIHVQTLYINCKPEIDLLLLELDTFKTKI